jgi:hypothetical protein
MVLPMLDSMVAHHSQGLLIFRPSLAKKLPPGGVREEQGDNFLVKLLNETDIGGLVVEYIFAEGRTAVQNTALTCTRVWNTLAEASVNSLCPVLR